MTITECRVAEPQYSSMGCWAEKRLFTGHKFPRYVGCAEAHRPGMLTCAAHDKWEADAQALHARLAAREPLRPMATPETPRCRVCGARARAHCDHMCWSCWQHRREAGEVEPEQPAPRKQSTVRRIVRDSELVRQVKTLYAHHCQICGVALTTQAGPYAEGAHIRPVGTPDNGPDVKANILCLCPNDHVRFDGLSICITDDLRVLDVATRAVMGTLTVHRRHAIGVQYLAYHRRMCGLRD